MKRRLVAVLFASVLACTALAGCGTSDSTAEAESSAVAEGDETESAAVEDVETEDTADQEEAELEVLTSFGDVSAEDAEYEPNTDYDKYTVVEYYMDAADTTLMITCSAKADDSEFYLNYSFYGDEQIVICDAEGNVSYDETGFMDSDTPDMIAYIIEQDIWSAMPE